MNVLLRNTERNYDFVKAISVAREFLEPRYDGRKSFYKKAKIYIDSNGIRYLVSYETVVARTRGGYFQVYGWFSATTSRHIKEFARQCGFDNLTLSKRDLTTGLDRIHGKIYRSDGEIMKLYEIPKGINDWAGQENKKMKSRNTKVSYSKEIAKDGTVTRQTIVLDKGLVKSFNRYVSRIINEIDNTYDKMYLQEITLENKDAITITTLKYLKGYLDNLGIDTKRLLAGRNTKIMIA